MTHDAPTQPRTSHQHAPRVAVVVSVYNAQDYLHDTVDSVLRQTHRDFLLILVNDGSTDDSPNLCNQFAQQDPRVHVVHQDNGGIAVAANAGVQIAFQQQCTYVARLDSDDRMQPTRLEKQTAFLDQHPDVVCVGSDVRLIDEASRFLTVERKPTGHDTLTDHLLRGHCPIANPACMIRTDALRAIHEQRPGPYDETYAPAEDFEIFLRLGEIGQLDNLAEPLTDYRLHAKSASAQRGRIQRDHCQRAVQEAAQRRALTNPPAFEGSDLWRPTAQRASQLEFALRYGWWAWKSGERHTAAHYGKRAVALSPLNKNAWALLLKSTLGHGPTADTTRPSDTREGRAA